MQEILVWHPLFNVYHLKNKDILLISESASFSLAHTHFALFNEFDGLQTTEEILANSKLIGQAQAQLIYQIANFKKQKLLIDKKQTELVTYVNEYTTNSQLLVQRNDYSVVNLSAVKEQSLTQWLDLIAQVTAITQLSSACCFILTDSFLNPAINKQLHLYERVCLIKITGEQLWLGSVLPAVNTYEYFSALQKRLKHNNPTLALAESLFADENLCIPYALQNVLSAMQIEVIKKELNCQLIQKTEQIAIIAVKKLTTEYHPLCLPNADSQTFSKRVGAAVKLKNCPVNFNHDGGSRTIAPEITVQNIKPFISPVTGLITHIRELNQSENNPVKIYATAFFKSTVLNESAKLSNESFVYSCMGKGVSHIQSQASALCEAIERYSSHYQGDEPLFLARKAQLDKRFYDFQQLVPYSQKQYQNFANVSHPDALLKQAALAYNDQAVHWLPVWSLSDQEHVYAPLTSCFANTPFADEQFARWHSNGCAAGNTLEEAILQALFELIERDATAIWWYNRIERPEFDMQLIDAEHFALLNATLSAEYDFWVLDLTHDVAVPVMVAVGCNKKTQGLSFGFGCHLQKELAAQRALTELCQLLPIREQNRTFFDFNAIQEGPHLFPAAQAEVQTADLTASGDLKIDIENIVNKLKALNLETLVLDYSREPLPIKTAKVFVPGLCHIWPQLANQRLYQVPVDLGWLEQANTEHTINPHALYV